MLALALLASATKWLHATFRVKTYVSYRFQLRLFLALSIYLSVPDFTYLSYILMFVEYLNMQGLCYPTIVNNFLLLRHFAFYPLHVYNVNHKVKMLLKAIAMNATHGMVHALRVLLLF